MEGSGDKLLNRFHDVGKVTWGIESIDKGRRDGGRGAKVGRLILQIRRKASAE